MKSAQLALLALLAAGSALAADPKPAADAKPVETKPVAAAKADIVDTAVGAGNFKTLAAALTAADLVSTLKGAGPFTVFAPTDEAFAKIPKADLDALLKDKAKLKSVLLYHVVPGNVPAADVLKMKDGSKVKTAGGKELTLGLKGGKVSLDKANVTATDIVASNGVIHVIDTVLMPK